MMRALVCWIACLLVLDAAAQTSGRKLPPFCGVSFRDKEKMIRELNWQFAFLKLQERDTVVDIGAASGWFEGAYSAASPLQHLHFVLVDIDSACLNTEKVNQMIGHYAALKGAPITHGFELVHNTPDSLFLPAATYGKAWLLNVLHEVDKKEKLLADIRSILREGGELVILELSPQYPGQLHGGCKKPLWDLAQWRAVLEGNGFHFVEEQAVRRNKRQELRMMRFVRA